MKIDITRLPLEGLELEEDISVSQLRIEDKGMVRLKGPVHIKASVSKITNTVTVAVQLIGSMKMTCGRCLDEFDVSLEKNLSLNYPLEKQQRHIDITDDIREEILLDYPIKPLCKEQCKGICPQCGVNLNVGECKCRR